MSLPPGASRNPRLALASLGSCLSRIPERTFSRRAIGWYTDTRPAEQKGSAAAQPNLRRKGAENGLGKNECTTRARGAQLAAIDEDWNCPRPLDWQRQYRVLADLVDANGQLPDIAPGVLMDGDDVGRCLQQRKRPATWARLLPEQRARLTALGVWAKQYTPSYRVCQWPAA